VRSLGGVWQVFGCHLAEARGQQIVQREPQRVAVLVDLTIDLLDQPGPLVVRP
jgi:hypothetical protein